jgi:hypothetical protein
MANNYYDGTGVLVLTKVTPVIKALFTTFAMDETTPGHGEVYIAKISESNSPCWDDVHEALGELIDVLKLQKPAEFDESMEDHLALLGSHYCGGNPVLTEALEQVIDRTTFEDDADLSELFIIAKCLDDGHGLTSIRWEGCWHCDKPRLFEFGGNAAYFGQSLNSFNSTDEAVNRAVEMDAALVANDYPKAADLASKYVQRMFTNFKSDADREMVLALMIQMLAPVPPKDTVKELKACLEDVLDADGDLDAMDFERYRLALADTSA